MCVWIVCVSISISNCLVHKLGRSERNIPGGRAAALCCSVESLIARIARATRKTRVSP